MTDKSINYFIDNGVKGNDLAFTNPYLRKAEILNALGRYDEAYVQSRQLYDMHKLSKKKDHEIFARIYTHMACAELGKKQLDNAQKHIKESIAIFLADETRNPKNSQFSGDVDLAHSYVVQGDIYSSIGNLREAVKFYREAQGIYFHLYKNNIGNIAHVSELYLKGAKAACRAKDLYHYKSFGEPQVKEFGKDHANTITMFEYCKNYNMDLWQEEN
jgi:tetratricopeptide (TPR) repeat protein